MDEQELNKRLYTLQDNVIRLNNAVMALGAYNIHRYPENFMELSLDTAVRAEKLACQLRHIIGDYGISKPQELMECVSDAQGIEIAEKNEMMMIKIPRLLPKWKHVRNGEFVNRPLFYAMEQYCKSHRITKFRECAVCFIHVYDKALSSGRIRDYDNMEMKHILDTVATFLMTDDTGILCDAYHTTEYGEDDCTLIYIMSPAELPAFILSRKSYPKSISNFDDE